MADRVLDGIQHVEPAHADLSLARAAETAYPSVKPGAVLGDKTLRRLTAAGQGGRRPFLPADNDSTTAWRISMRAGAGASAWMRIPPS